ncbi:MAG: alpha-L-arabinofuranosidase [Butyrivibrio sp.]|jgi:alpha-L-arabinofuranosidase|nr:alpha-L-arabinofuranosidase [Butyrivibrio sp.]
MSSLNVETKNVKIPVNKSLYGVFIEDINRAMDGGLYPEMIRNRTFEDSILPSGVKTDQNGYKLVTPSGWKDEFNHGEGLSRWVRENQTAETEIPAWYTDHAHMELDRKDTLNENRSVSLLVSFEENGKIVNIGYSGIDVIKNEEYRVVLFAETQENAPLKLYIEDGRHIVCSNEIIVNAGNYGKYECTLTAEASARGAHFVIRSQEKRCIRFGYCSLMPADTYLGHGLRIDLMEKLKALQPGFVRFPGGCVVEGITPDTVMTFRKTIGDAWERPGHLLMWHYRTTTGLGYHEYLQMCEDLGAQPIYVCNCGMTCQARKSVNLSSEGQQEMIQDTLDAIAYANEPATGTWGKIRAVRGHQDPFHLTYVEIGNENWGKDYEERYEKCRKAIHDKFPEIKFIANAHVEKNGYKADFVDEHYYETTESFAQTADRFDGYSRSGPQIMLGEVSVVRGYIGQLYGALGEAALLTGIEKNQDVISFVAYAPLLENVNFNAWRPNLIRFNGSESIGIPSYYVWKMFAAHRGENVIQTQLETGRQSVPVKGMGSLMGAYGQKFRNAKWNGRKVSVTHELMGQVKQSGDDMELMQATQEQLAEGAMLSDVDLARAFIVFGEETVTEGTFSVEVENLPGKEIMIGAYSSRIPKGVYVPDETNPPREFNPENVQPFRWCILNGKSTVYRPGESGREGMCCKEEQVALKENDFNEFMYKAAGDKISFYLNGELIHTVDIPKFPTLFAVAETSQEDIILKIVNLSAVADPVRIRCDCEIAHMYETICVKGEKEGENTFEFPEHIADVNCLVSGAAKEFVFEAPPFSANVLILHKKNEINY